MTLNVDIRKLSEIHDIEPTFISLYLNIEKDFDDFLNSREQAIRGALAEKTRLKNIFYENMQKVRTHLTENIASLQRKGVRGIAIFHSKPMDFFEAHPIPMEVENAMIVDSSPYIRPMAKFLEEYEDFGIILLDHNHARIYLVKAGEIAETERLHEEIFHHHKKGGFSQMRFQRKRDGELVHFYKDIAEQATKVFEGVKIRRLIVAGQSDAKKNFIPYLPKFYQDKIIAVLNIETETPDEDVVKDAFPVFFEKEREEEIALVEEFMGAVMKGENAAYGLADVLERTKNGRAERILINMGFKSPGYKCEADNVMKLRPGSCDLCGGNLLQVDAVEELVEWAQQSSAKVEFIAENESLETLGGVGAFLRW
jgi:peptide chain release factor subunit 1